MDATLIRIINEHMEKYPLMTVRDLLKLVYQHEFGCAHAIRDPAHARAWLMEEYRSVNQKEAPLYEDIGGGFARVYLDALDNNGVSPETVLDCFVKSAEPAGDMSEFISIIRELPELPACARFPLSETKAYIEEYINAGCPAVHHSEAYNEAYHPAYRVVRTELLKRLKIY